MAREPGNYLCHYKGALWLVCSFNSTWQAISLQPEAIPPDSDYQCENGEVLGQFD